MDEHEINLGGWFAVGNQDDRFVLRVTDDLSELEWTGEVHSYDGRARTRHHVDGDDAESNDAEPLEIGTESEVSHFSASCENVRGAYTSTA